jgi:hypothetical protein
MDPVKASKIRALQALSTFYVGEQPVVRGTAYPFVALRCVAQYLDMDARALRTLLEPLARQGFCELTSHEVRLAPSHWSLNKSHASLTLAHYVANAPAPLRSPYAQLPIDPTRCYNPQPVPEFHGTTVVSNFNGVYNNEQSAPVHLGPYEHVPPYSTSADATLTVAENLNFLTTRLTAQDVLFRAFLSRCWLSSHALQTVQGPVDVFLTDYVQDVPCLVAAPCDDLWFDCGGLWSPAAFVAPLNGRSLELRRADSFPISFSTLQGGAIVLTGDGSARVTAPTGSEHLDALFEWKGSCLGGSVLISLLATTRSAA